MSCSVYKVDLLLQRRYYVTNILKHTDMSKWLKVNGISIYIYEIWKPRGIHSRWQWKKKGKWGRMATPRKKTKE